MGAHTSKIPYPWQTAPSPTPSSISLRAKLMGTDDFDSGQWDKLGEIYMGFFMDGVPELPEELPTLLESVFRYLHFNKTCGINSLTNGAGKSPIFRLLHLLPLGHKVRFATTNDPRHDWCGIDRPQIAGVVDVGKRSNSGGYWQVVGEVKVGLANPFVENVAAMHAASEEGDGHWPYGEELLFWKCQTALLCSPYAGFTINQRAFNVLIATLPREPDNVVKITTYCYCATNLSHVVQFLDHVQCLIDEDTCTAGLRQLTLARDTSDLFGTPVEGIRGDDGASQERPHRETTTKESNHDMGQRSKKQGDRLGSTPLQESSISSTSRLSFPHPKPLYWSTPSHASTLLKSVRNRSGNVASQT